ncbi:NAD-dependent protein deacylase Sirt4-like [Artemia franciscana]|uniref:NAD-dependent protein deacylase n=1 Tax=Artemia franciscana TaxID=6661 RepID=A0AA88HNU8_ARTSF|nr:hypothetical protein QYM36_008918 [Artemia franciscana]
MKLIKCHLSRFIPHHYPVMLDDVWKFQEFLFSNPRILCLTGAGISTESGIPDYRSEGVGLYATSKSRPVQFQDFISNPKIRQRYWARNFHGWPHFSSVQPNDSHRRVAEMEQNCLLSAVVTQNVDRLHTKAGCTNVIELHGTAHEVICMQCNYRISRYEFQETLKGYNEEHIVKPIEVRPDSDVELTQMQIEGFFVPPCPNCFGVLKPDIVFFGDNVPKSRVDKVFNHLEESDALLVLGSSLYVYSGYRFTLRAKELNKSIAIINIGKTRADHLADLKINAKLSDILKSVKC